MDPAYPIAQELEPTIFGVYIAETHNLVQNICHRCERIFERTKSLSPAKENNFAVDPETHFLIHGVLTDSAKLKKLVIPPVSRGKKEPRRHFELRQYRCAVLYNRMPITDASEIFDPKIRNSIEHFDEYLDDAVLLVSNKQTRPAPKGAYNLTVYSWATFAEPPYPIKLYVSSEKVFYNFSWKIDIGRIYAEAMLIRQALLESPDFPKHNNPYGLLCVFL